MQRTKRDGEASGASINVWFKWYRKIPRINNVMVVRGGLVKGIEKYRTNNHTHTHIQTQRQSTSDECVRGDFMLQADHRAGGESAPRQWPPMFLPSSIQVDRFVGNIVLAIFVFFFYLHLHFYSRNKSVLDAADKKGKLF